jgi:hypothetical protein
MQKCTLLVPGLLVFQLAVGQMVGIGTTEPMVPLHLNSTSAAEMLRIAGNGPYISFFSMPANTYQGYLWLRSQNPNSIDLGTASGSNLPVSISPNTNTTALFYPNGPVSFSAPQNNEFTLALNQFSVNRNGLLIQVPAGKTAIIGEAGIGGGINLPAGFAVNRAAQFLSAGGVSTVGFSFDADGNAATNKAGGWFGIVDQNGGTISRYAFVGAQLNGTAYKIVGTGAVSTVVKDLQGEDRILFAPEAPDNVLQDYGTGVLVNGEARVLFDPILAKNILVDNGHPLKVFVQLEGDCEGVFVHQKSNQGFVVSELNGGKSSVPFSWMIVAQRADEQRGGQTIRYQVDRFTKAPAPATLLRSQ